MKRSIFCAALGAMALLTACKPTQKATETNGNNGYWKRIKTPQETAALDTKIERLFHSFCGIYDNFSQADTAKMPELSIAQQVVNIPIWTDRVGEYWAYSGWFLRGNDERPLAQDILQFVRVNQDTFKIVSYKLPAESERAFYAHEWKKEKPFANLRPRDLIHEATNYNYAVEEEKNVFRVFEGDAPSHYPLSDQREYCHYRLVISSEGINEFSQYFNKNMELTFEFPKPNGFVLKRKPKPQL